MKKFEVTSKAQAQTELVAQALGTLIPLGTIIGLRGEIGAGKTIFTKGFAKGLDVTEPITSPSYPIILEYEFPKGLFIHMDWYRTSGPDEIELLGIEEYFTPSTICIIEWANRAPDLLPSFALDISIEVVNSHDRRMILTLPDQLYDQLLIKLKDSARNG